MDFVFGVKYKELMKSSEFRYSALEVAKFSVSLPFEWLSKELECEYIPISVRVKDEQLNKFAPKDSIKVNLFELKWFQAYKAISQFTPILTHSSGSLSTLISLNYICNLILSRELVFM